MIVRPSTSWYNEIVFCPESDFLARRTEAGLWLEWSSRSLRLSHS
uniref:Uncharacterized protein n=1 Tax=Aegilops tauschii subsp. strangulata TaxID=200361 RepID=A0A453EA63_AEGTS